MFYGMCFGSIRPETEIQVPVSNLCGGREKHWFFLGGGGGQGLRPGRGVAGGEGASVGSSLEGGGAGRNRVLVQGDAAACRRKPADGVRDIFNTHA